MLLSVLAVVVGVIAGAAWGRDVDVLWGGLLGWLLVRSLRQRRELTALRQAMNERPAPPAAVPVAADGGMAGPAVAEALPEAASAPQAWADEMVAPAGAAEAASPPAPTPTPLPETPDPGAWPQPLAAAPSAPAPDPLAGVKAWLFGGNTIVKAGVGILFIGLAFLAKYASEHVSLPIELRLAGVAAVALALLVTGWRLRGRRAGYAQVLQGGAVAVLYLVLFAAFRFYGVLQGLPAFVLMVAIAALAAALAVLQEAPALAIVGALGGFATPLLVSTGSGDPVALFSYYLVLDLGIAAIAWFRTWRVLNVVGFLCTFLVATLWGVLKYEPERYASSQAFLIAYFLLFVTVLLLPARRVAAAAPAGLSTGPAAGEGRWVNGSLLFGLPTIAFALQYGLVRDWAWGPAVSALVGAAFYIGLASRLRGRSHLALVFEGSLAIGTVLLTLVVPFALDARSTAGAWSLEAAGLVWLGLRQRRLLARLFGYALFLIAGGAMLLGLNDHAAPTQWLNAMLFNTLMAAAAALVAAHVVRQQASTAAPAEAIAEPLLVAWALLWLLWGGAVHIDALMTLHTGLSAWVAWLSLVALGLAALHRWQHWPLVSRPALGHLPLMLLAAAASGVLQRNPLAHGGAWAWALALLAHGAVLHWAAPDWPAAARRMVHVLGALLLATLGALLGRHLFGDLGDQRGAWPWLGWLLVPALLLALLPRPRTAALWPVRAEPQAYQGAAAGWLALAGLLWSLLANTVSDGTARPLPYVPLVNPLDLGIAGALAAAWAWWRGEGGAGLRARQPAAGPVLLGGMAFLWLNGMLVRSFHHHGGVPYHFDDWMASLAVQTGLTLLWSSLALALMWAAARRALRPLWITGAGLLGVVVLKLLLVDLSGSGTVTRIVSFIGVGLLMLVIGYVAPLPATPRQTEDSQHAQ